MTSSGTKALRGRVVVPAELAPAERAAWREFCAASSFLDHPFYAPGFAEAVARVRPHVRVCILEENGAVAGFLPYQFAGAWERALGAAEQIGGDMADYFGVIARPSLKLSPEELLAAAGIEALPFHHLVEDQLGFGLVGEAPEPGHRIVIGDDPAEYWRRLKAANKSFVSEVERRQRKIVEALGPLRFTFAVADPVARLERLIAHKRGRYQATGVADVLAPAWKRALMIELARGGDPDCLGVLSELYAGDTWVASHFGLRGRGVLHYWFPVYNDDLSRFAPGHLLVRRIVEESAALGLRVIDRGAGDQPHKTAWLTERHSFRRGLWWRRSPRAVAYRVQLAAAWRLKEWARRSRDGAGRAEKKPES